MVTPAGGRIWRLKYRFNGREKLLVIGPYPSVGLAEARRKRDAAKVTLADGADPAAEKQARKRARRLHAQNTFEAVARDWHGNQKGAWDERYSALVLRRLEQNLFPSLGDRPIAEIEPAEVLAALKTVEARGVLETTRRVKQYCSSVFCYGIASGQCRHDPSVPLKRALRPPARTVHRAKLATNEVGAFLLQLAKYDGEPVTRLALEFTLLTATRTKEIVSARWDELERLDSEDHALWRVPAARMKMGQEHLVPLSRQAVRVVESLPRKERGGFLFPGAGKGGTISNNTMLYGIYRLGYHSRTTTHGFRRLFSTEANENGFDKDWIERQLAHDERDDVRGAYNAAEYLGQRRRLMQWWADYLDGLRDAEILRLTQTGEPGCEQQPA